MKKISVLFSSFSLLILLSACTLGAMSAEQLEATAQHIASTGIVLTLTALPSSTPLPSATPQPTATETPPAPTVTETPTLLPTSVPTFLPTLPPYGQLEGTNFATAQANKDDRNAPLLLQNNSGEDIKFILLSPVYQEYEFHGNLSLILPEGQYSYRAWIGDKGPFTGSFAITNGDKHVLTFNADKIHFSTP